MLEYGVLVVGTASAALAAAVGLAGLRAAGV